MIVAPLQEALLSANEVLSYLTRVFPKGICNILSGTWGEIYVMCLLAKRYMSHLTKSPTLVQTSMESIEWFQGGRGNLSSLFETP